MSLIYETNINGPATHALVIGVGYYAHLPGGRGLEHSHHEGLGQLTSPPHSAREFGGWLLKDYNNPGKPLATLDMLISEPGDSVFNFPGSDPQPVERATFMNVKNALIQWNLRGNDDPENLMILFFCGHGVMRSYATSLLMEDFGSNPFNPLDTALDFRRFYNGMDLCEARRQCYFIDACRKASPNLIKRYNDYTGQPVIPGSAFHSNEIKRTAPIFYATMPGDASYGITDKPSVFTDALIKALKGAGSHDRDDEGVWRVDTNTLNDGIDFLLRLALGDSQGIGQIVSVDEMVRLPLHYLDGDPIIPVTIGCRPQEANLAANLGYKSTQAVEPILRPDIDETHWQLDLGPGDYNFFADFPNHEYNPGSKDRWISPPYQKIFLEVSS